MVLDRLATRAVVDELELLIHERQFLALVQIRFLNAQVLIPWPTWCNRLLGLVIQNLLIQCICVALVGAIHVMVSR